MFKIVIVVFWAQVILADPRAKLKEYEKKMQSEIASEDGTYTQYFSDIVYEIEGYRDINHWIQVAKTATFNCKPQESNKDISAILIEFENIYTSSVTSMKMAVEPFINLTHKLKKLVTDCKTNCERAKGSKECEECTKSIGVKVEGLKETRDNLLPDVFKLQAECKKKIVNIPDKIGVILTNFCQYCI